MRLDGTRRVAALIAAAALGCSLAVVLSAVPAASGGTHVWGWVTSRLPHGYDEYDPAPHLNTRTSAGASSTVERVGKGVYHVFMRGVGAIGGTLHVTAFGSKPRICDVLYPWAPFFSDEVARVVCYDLEGNLADSRFTINYVHAADLSRMGYLYVSDGYDSDTVCSGDDFYDSAGGCIRVTVDDIGRYTVTMDGLGGLSGNVQVTAVDDGTCRISSWGSTTEDQVIGVSCRSLITGDFYPTEFRVTYMDGLGFQGAGEGKAAYLRANRPKAASYLPAAAYRWSSSGQGPRVTRESRGQYTVRLLGIDTHGGSAQVTAYGGTGDRRCQISSISIQGSPATVGILCYTPNGTPADSKFSFAFTR